jgi:hypothetical protein
VPEELTVVLLLGGLDAMVRRGLRRAVEDLGSEHLKNEVWGDPVKSDLGRRKSYLDGSRHIENE